MTQLNALMLARGQDTILDSLSISVNTDYNLPSAVRQGQVFLILSEVTNNAKLTIKASNGDTVDIIRSGYCLLVALQNSPTTGAHWKVMEVWEEGIWTPALSAVSGTAPVGVSYSNQEGNYYRKNNLITANFVVTWGSVTTPGTGTGVITGIPYGINSATTSPGPCATQFIDWASSHTNAVVYAANADTVLRLQLSADNLANAFLDTSAFSGGSFSKRITGQVTYKRAGNIIN